MRTVSSNSEFISSNCRNITCLSVCVFSHSYLVCNVKGPVLSGVSHSYKRTSGVTSSGFTVNVQNGIVSSGLTNNNTTTAATTKYIHNGRL